MIDALRRASAATINVVIPYYGYARQDRKARSREPLRLIGRKYVANGRGYPGLARLHAAQIQGFSMYQWIIWWVRRPGRLLH